MAKHDPTDALPDVLEVAKALADENRVRILLFLQAGECCVCEIIEMLALAPSTVSRHLTVLHQAGLVASRKDGRWVHYRLPDEDAAPHVREALAWVRRALERDRQVRQDARHLSAVRRMDRKVLCNHYRSAE